MWTLLSSLGDFISYYSHQPPWFSLNVPCLSLPPGFCITCSLGQEASPLDLHTAAVCSSDVSSLARPALSIHHHYVTILFIFFLALIVIRNFIIYVLTCVLLVSIN